MIQTQTYTIADDSRTIFHQFLLEAQQRICKLIEHLDASYSHSSQFTPQCFQMREWSYTQQGGGVSNVLRNGCVFEKAGVNVSRVSGTFSQEMSKQIPGTEKSSDFEAMGLSLVIHPRSPHVPIVHLNVRYIHTEKSWFGGGADLTPSIPYDEDTAFFHGCLREAYDQIDKEYYPLFKKGADAYFYIPHRQENRGVGGSFYDYINTNWQKDFALSQATVEAFCKSYKEIVSRRMYTPISEEDTKAQLKKRARYVEFNLIYDRGTLFGLKTGGDIEAILVSMPPLAGW